MAEEIKRLFVVDPSLRDYVGHHYAYDKAILDACAKQGIQCEVFAHKDASRYLPLEDGIASVYSQDMWRQRKGPKGFSVSVRVAALRFLQGMFVIPALPSLAGSKKLAPYRARVVRGLALLRRILRQLLPPRVTRRRLVGLFVPRGLLAVSKALVEGARFVVDNLSIPRWLLKLVLPNPRFYFETRQALQARRVGKGDLVFCHMIFHAQLLEWALLGLESAARSGEQIVLLLRYSADLYLPRSLRSRLAFRALEHAWHTGHLRLATDSERLARDFAPHTFIPIEVYPIPHVASGHVPTTPTGGRPIRFVSLGNARAEKGILEILRAIEILHAAGDANGLEFVLQVNDPDPLCDADTKRFMAKQCSAVRFIKSALDNAAYEQLLNESDVVLVPYWRDVYASRTSGVFIEAVAAGKIVVATSGTWMADELKRFGGGVIVPSRSPAQLADAIRRIRGRISELISRAATAGGKCRSFHSPQRFIDALLRGQGVYPRTRSAAVLYPWDNFLTRAAGASLRTGLLMDVIESKGYHLNVLLSSANQVQQAPSRYTVFRFDGENPSASINKLLSFFVFFVRIATLGRSRPADWILYLYLVWNRRRRFRLVLSRALRGCSVMFLEYTFLASVVRPMARCYGVPLVISEHDVLADQAPWMPLRRRLLRLESESLRMADFPVCVSEDDRAVFASQGVDAQVIPNSVAVPELIGLTAEEARRTVSEAGATLPERYVLFIGSAHGPNNDAANFLRELAESFALSGGEVSIVVAGTCHAPLQEPTFRALGRVSDAVKDALYVLGAAVVAPLVSGTGTSLKTIEAMAMGKTVIGTSMAFRGLGVTHGKNAIVEDDLQSYEWLLPDLLEDADRLTDIGREARRLAEQFDYRRTYRPYMEYLDSLDIVRPLTGN